MVIPRYPKRIVIELTNKCNLNCQMCPRHYVNGEEGYISENLWQRLVDEIEGASPDSIVIPFWRGEALLHPKFTEFMDYVLSKSLKIHIATNGTMVCGKFTETLSSFKFINFSVHNEVGYERAKEFLAARKDRVPVVQLSFIRDDKVTSRICDSLVKSNDLEGFDCVRIYDEHTKDGIFGKLHKRRTNSSRPFCPRLLDTLAISYNGYVSRCCHLWDTGATINIKDSTIKEVWDSKHTSQIRDKYPDSRCKECDQWMSHTAGESYVMVEGAKVHKRYEAEVMSAT